MRDSSDEEGAKFLSSQQRRITAQIMRNLEKLRQAANHIPSTRSEKLHHTQHILAKDDLNSILSNDMPDNEEQKQTQRNNATSNGPLRPGSHASLDFSTE